MNELVDRIFARCKRTANGCLEWQGALASNGYGRMYVNKKRVRVHRVVCEALNGAIRPGYETLHSCDNRKCVEPSHLSIGTRSQNMKQAFERGRWKPWSGAAKAKLTTNQVSAIRKAYSEKQANQHQLARQYGVTQPAISLLLSGRNWASV